MPETNADSDASWKHISAARNAARRAAIALARDGGELIITRPAFPGAEATVSDVEPLAGLRAARELELGACHTARGYAREAREAGHTWHDIGIALGLRPGADASRAGESVAEAAYSYVAGQPDSETARRYGRSFSWRCASCEQVISDRGLIASPADDEHGHADRCKRLAATVAAWDVQWEAEA